MTRNFFSVVLIMLMCWSLNACSKSEEAATIPQKKTEKILVARLNGEPIFEDDLLRRIGTVEKDPALVKTNDPQRWNRLVEGALDGEILDRLVLQAAKEKGMTVSPDDLEKAYTKSKEMLGEEKFAEMLKDQQTSEKAYRAFLEERILIDQYKDKILADLEIPEDVIEEYYDGHGTSFMSEERVKLEVLVVDSAEMADEAYEKFKEGQPFDDLMEKFSILKERGLTGRTRWIPYKSLPQEVQFLIQGSEVGDILAPVKTKDGYYVIKIIDRQEPAIIPYEKAKDMIAESLLRNREAEALDDWYVQAREKATVEYINP